MPRWIASGLLAGLTLLASAAWAQDDPTRFRLQDALDATDRRIELATSLVAEASNPPASVQLELTAARDIQARARAAFAANQPLMAYRATLEARAHADRAIAIVRGLPDPDRVTAQVERTRDILDRARDRLQACDNDRARALLRVAIDMQLRAEARLDASMYLGALQLTMSARERVQKAMQLCNVNESMADAVDRAIQRTNEVLSRAQDTVTPGAPQDARDMLARAQSIEVQAQAEASLSKDESAMRLTQDSRALALRAIRAARPGLRVR
jgi:hypothetical protein